MAIASRIDALHRRACRIIEPEHPAGLGDAAIGTGKHRPDRPGRRHPGNQRELVEPVRAQYLNGLREEDEQLTMGLLGPGVQGCCTVERLRSRLESAYPGG